MPANGKKLLDHVQAMTETEAKFTLITVHAMLAGYIDGKQLRNGGPDIAYRACSTICPCSTKEPDN